MDGDAVTGGGMLLDDDARALYLAILRQGGRLRMGEVDDATRGPLQRLLDLGLVIAHIPDAAYSAVSPRTAGESLAVALRADANRALRAAREAQALFGELAQAFDASRKPGGRPTAVEHIVGMEQIRHRVTQLAVEARHEALAAQPGGARPAEHLAASLPGELSYLERGRSSRTIYQPAARADRATANYAATMTAAGARFRVLDEPFQRFFVFDRTVAVIPAAKDNTAAAFIEDPVTVALLVDLFERDWERAERVRWESASELPDAGTIEARVAQLLATGLTQRTVAARLGLSERTVAGYIARLRRQHEAETTFQLGWLMRGRTG